ncbi:uncharacterized protein LOC129766018 [Toxorhynchites rutilus septentrionalis]|uniref:uncharacterized protein LOC129766018 n=1 Tax=Toxorhynchites rutilus septentrionalis TaxID=329112 RepID=UPI0024785939|nr:uncharacterized protein LOC129766018 [Toxorhynchites rutilus septentrionalis]
MQVPRQPASVQKIPAQQLPVQSTPWQPYKVQRSPVQYPHVQQPPAQYPQVQRHPMMQYSVQDLPIRQSHIQQPPMQQHPLYYLPIQQPPAQYPQTQQSTIQPQAQFAPMQQSTYQSPLQPLQAQTPPTQHLLMQQPSTNNPPSSWEEPPPDWNQDEGESIPTPRQLTSRQSLARDLPTFSGDPAEWSIFISNFEYTTTTCGYTHGKIMVRLQRCLRGRALESVRSRLVFPAAVPQVIETLRMRYGRPELLINALLQKVRAMPAPRGDKLEALIEYRMVVQDLCDHIQVANERAHLANPTLLQELVGKLPADQKLMWAGYKRGRAVVDLKTFSDYMTGVMQHASSVVLYESDPRKNTARDKSKVYVNSHKADETATTTTTQLKTSRCLHCEKEGHKLRECQAFRALSIDDRWRRIRALTLCQICLYGHGRRACRFSSKCNVNGCQFKHHPLLHGKATTPVTQLANINTHRPQDSGVLFRILPVTLYGKSGQVNTFAFLDEGSSLTLVEGGLVAQLGIAGDSQPLCLRWTGNTSRVEKNSKTVTITVSGLEPQRRYQLVNARTVQNLDLPMQSFDVERATKRFAHLRQLPIQSYHNARPAILIGLDNLKLAVPLKTREGDGSRPIAVKTRLGWCVYGRQGSQVNEGFSFHICGCNRDDELHEAVKQFFAVEESGVRQLGDCLSAEEQRAQEMLEKKTKRIGRHYETGLLWTEEEIELPDSYGMALQRHQCLQRRMDRNLALRENISRQIKEYVEKGYAHRATPAELENANPRKAWFLPLGAVTNPNKPGKVRLIWDAAAKASGVSLNSVLLKGPDQLTLLPTVLFRFRLYYIAVSADIEQMFHQLGIIQDDKNSLRFLWSDTADGPVQIYLKDVATFGATCSPASAQYVKNENAQEHIKQYPRAVEGILKSHYVDDYLDSFGTETQAVKVSAEVRLIHHNGGFHLRNWRSNSERVLTELGKPAVIDSKNLNLDCGEQVDRVLGMLWTSSSSPPV